MSIFHQTKIFVYIISLVVVCLNADIASSSNKFANKLYNILTQKSKNIFFSPISIHSLLTVIYQGAVDDTAKTLHDVLDLPKAIKEYEEILSNLSKLQNITLYIANNVYINKNYKLKEDFAAAVNIYFNANIENIDFNNTMLAAHQINEWIKNKTNNKIDNMISSNEIEEETRLVLLNAIYFEAMWLYPFKEQLTQSEKFHISETETVNCQMMHTTNTFLYLENFQLDAKILKISTMNKHINLVIILPNKGKSIKDLEKQLSLKDLANLTQDMTQTRVIVSLPKFKLETSMQLNEPLEELGLGNIFHDKAKLSNMIDSNEPLKVGKVIQKAFTEINERGSKASVATRVSILKKRSLDITENEFQANRPFVFYVIESNKIIIFLGKLTNPSKIVVHDEL